ncbi:MAG: hypothetical protein OXO52_17425 [Rhodospirillales bacterium]|nr:hypothetical protein [Rhodospirillales bacterium]MDE0379702.1 hypothetical protein [Rhodospirillales bacterium]
MRRSAAASRRPGLVAAAAIFAAFAAADAAWGQGNAPVQAAAANLSSHDAGFFSELLSGRVWVLERPNSRLAADRNTVWAHYHAPDGSLLACAHLGGTYAPGTARWRTVPSRAFRSLYNYLEPGAEPDPGRRRGHTPLFYDPGTGRLHNEALGGRGWTIASAGWVQESWPRAMREACPALPLPPSLAVNEKQTAVTFDAMMAQDPDAAIRYAPGSDLKGPGAVGIAASGGRQMLSGADLARFLEENDGFVLTDLGGGRHVLALGAAGDELWLLGEGGAVADVGLLVPAAQSTEIAIHYERLPLRPRYRIGDPLPFLPTGERHIAFRITDRLAGSGVVVTLPLPGLGETAVRLGPDGNLVAGDGSGGHVPGTWRWSQGSLALTLKSAPEPVHVSWRTLAERAGESTR